MKIKKNMWRGGAAVLAAAFLAVAMPLSAQAATTYTVSAVSPTLGYTTNTTITVADGDSAVVEGSGFAAGSTVFVGVCDQSTLGTACDEDATVEVTASTAGTFTVTVPLSEEFASWNPHTDTTSGTITCASVGSTSCAILIVQHSGTYPYVIQPLTF
ncbi:MAG: neocarzinostatin apoprotein domain-containing protein [Microbacterium sp.]|uniref:neocarzinostatin apoprotein domain-containing protein n=1 Tax=Microbacterium sp. TaxID=51671 RepID=UPI0039E680B0